MARTRSKPVLKEGSDDRTKTDSIVAKLPSSDPDPARLFILPTGISEEARILSLKCAATHRPLRYLFCPEQGLYEFTRVLDGKKTLRSWLVATPTHSKDGSDLVSSNLNANEDAAPPTGVDGGYLSRDPDLFIATPIDELFAILPIITPGERHSHGQQKQLFRTLDDHLDADPEATPYLHHILQYPKARRRIERRMRCVCDTVEAGEDQMYRLSTSKLLEELLRKANGMVATGLPASIEDRFVTKALQVPVPSIKSLEVATNQAPADSQAGTPVPDVLTQDASETSSTTTQSTDSQVSSATSLASLSTSESAPDISSTVSDEVIHLLRLRTALAFILSSYVAPSLRKLLNALLCTQKSVDFTPLDAHLSHLAKLRAEAQAMRSFADNMTHKRGLEDDEAAEARAEKRRKKEEEEKKKKLESRGMKDLKKADIGGMKKLSNFFQKVPKKS